MNEKASAMQETTSWTEGWRQGFVEGSRIAARNVCLAVIHQHHPAVLSLVGPHIKACPSHVQLVEWAVASSDLSDDALVVLVTGKPPVRAARSRTSRPSRALRRPSSGRKRR